MAGLNSEKCKACFVLIRIHFTGKQFGKLFYGKQNGRNLRLLGKLFYAETIWKIFYGEDSPADRKGENHGNSADTVPERADISGGLTNAFPPLNSAIRSGMENFRIFYAGTKFMTSALTTQTVTF